MITVTERQKSKETEEAQGSKVTNTFKDFRLD